MLSGREGCGWCHCHHDKESKRGPKRGGDLPKAKGDNHDMGRCLPPSHPDDKCSWTGRHPRTNSTHCKSLEELLVTVEQQLSSSCSVAAFHGTGTGVLKILSHHKGGHMRKESRADGGRLDRPLRELNTRAVCGATRTDLRSLQTLGWQSSPCRPSAHLSCLLRSVSRQQRVGATSPKGNHALLFHLFKKRPWKLFFPISQRVVQPSMAV
jgi:hypothetical protein